MFKKYFNEIIIEETSSNIKEDEEDDDIEKIGEEIINDDEVDDKDEEDCNEGEVNDKGEEDCNEVDDEGEEEVKDEGEEEVNDDSEEEIDIESKLNYYDEDEDIEDKLYIISIDNIPHLYGKDLKDLRVKMWEIANALLKSSKNENEGYYIFTNNLNEIKIICPYDFFILKYHHVLYELKIDYVLNYNLYIKKTN